MLRPYYAIGLWPSVTIVSHLWTQCILCDNFSSESFWIFSTKILGTEKRLGLIQGIVALPVYKQKAIRCESVFLFFCTRRVYCSSDFRRVFNEFLRKIHSGNMHSIIELLPFLIQEAQKGNLSKLFLQNDHFHGLLKIFSILFLKRALFP